jgi:hypothetical protein
MNRMVEATGQNPNFCQHIAIFTSYFRRMPTANFFSFDAIQHPQFFAFDAT